MYLLGHTFDKPLTFDHSYKPANISEYDGLRFYLAGLDSELYGRFKTPEELVLLTEARRLLHDYRRKTGEWTKAQHERAETIRLRNRKRIDTDGIRDMERTDFGPLIINGETMEGSEID